MQAAAVGPYAAARIKAPVAGAEARKPLVPRLSPAVWISLVFGLLIAVIPELRMASKVPFLLVLSPLVVWTAFKNSEQAIYVYIAWCWFDGAIRGVFNDSAVSILARDIVMAVILVGWALRRRGESPADPVLTPPVTLALALFAADCLVQFANPFNLGLLSSVAGLKAHLSAIPLFFIAYDVFREKRQLRELAIFLTIISVIGSLVMLNQYQHGREWTYAHYVGTDKAILSDMQLQKNGVHGQQQLRRHQLPSSGMHYLRGRHRRVRRDYRPLNVCSAPRQPKTPPQPCFAGVDRRCPSAFCHYHFSLRITGGVSASLGWRLFVRMDLRRPDSDKSHTDSTCLHSSRNAGLERHI